IEDAAADDEPRWWIRVDDFLKGFEVIRCPDVVVTQIGDPRPAGETNPLVVGRAVAAAGLRPIGPGDPGRAKRLDGRPGIVIAPVGEDGQLEIADGLMQDRLDRGPDVLAATVRGQDDREGVVGELGGLDSRTSAPRSSEAPRQGDADRPDIRARGGRYGR